MQATRAPQDAARRALEAWREAQPDNAFTSDPQLQRLLARLMPADRLSAALPHFAHFGAVVMGDLDRAAALNNRPHNLPRLDRWTDLGRRTEGLEHHPSYDDCGRGIYQDGRVIAVYGQGPANLHAQALFYLSSHVGEAGHNCPVACTAGIVKALEAQGSDALKSHFMPGLLTDRYPDRLDGAQFLTEVQGGSDVGANAVVAEPDGEGLGTTRWRITGEKWFCSNAAADLILMTARVAGGPDGTKGLGLFLVPRELDDGSVNHFTVRRLKDKIGTRSMPSGEMDFHGAVAYAVGPVERGFKTVMQHVIRTSRLYNAVGQAGCARRARLVAESYAEHRSAFGSPIARFPLVHAMLANIRAPGMASTAAGLDLAARFDAEERGELDADRQAHLRVATNLLKMRAAQHTVRVIQEAILVLGGNGAIESFSVLPRLLRDNVVYENWEGTHNTLVAQCVRDFAGRGLHEGYLATLTRDLHAVPDATAQGELAPCVDAMGAFKDALPGLGKAAANDPGLAGFLLQPHLERLADAQFAVALAHDVSAEPDAGRRDAEVEALRWFVQTQVAGRRGRDRDTARRAAIVATLEG